MIRFVPRGQSSVATLTLSELAAPDQGEEITLTRGQETELPNEVAVGFTDAVDEDKSGAVSATRLAGYSERKSDLRLALVMDQVQAQSIADRALVEAWIEREVASFALPPSRIALDPGDVIDLVVNGGPRAFRLKRITDRGLREVEAVRAEAAIYAPPLNGIAPPTLTPPPIYGAAVLRLMDLPLLRDSDDGFSPYAAACASPWGGVVVMDSATGSDFVLDTTLAVRATIGETIQPLAAGPTEYWDEGSVLEVKLRGTGERHARHDPERRREQSRARHVRRGLGDHPVRRRGADGIANLSADEAAARTARHRARHPLAARHRSACGSAERSRFEDRRQARRTPCRPLLSLGTAGA